MNVPYYWTCTACEVAWSGVGGMQCWSCGATENVMPGLTRDMHMTSSAAAWLDRDAPSPVVLAHGMMPL